MCLWVWVRVSVGVGPCVCGCGSLCVCVCVGACPLLWLSPLMPPACSSGSVELEEVCERASRALRDCSMLSRLLEVGNCRYFSGT